MKNNITREQKRKQHALKCCNNSLEVGFKQGIDYAMTLIKMELVKQKGYEQSYKLLKSVFINLEKKAGK